MGDINADVGHIPALVNCMEWGQWVDCVAEVDMWGEKAIQPTCKAPNSKLTLSSWK